MDNDKWIILLILVIIICTAGTYYFMNTKNINEKNEIISKNELTFRQQLITYQQLEQKYNTSVAYINNFWDYTISLDSNYDEIETINNQLNDINITLNYISCEDYVDKYKSSTEKLQKGTTLIYNYFTTTLNYRNATKCQYSLVQYSLKSQAMVTAQEQYVKALDNWCFGFFKLTTWSSTWMDDYSYPITKASADVSSASKTYTAATRDLDKSCFG